MADQKKKLYLIDGTALIYRAYYAFLKNPLFNTKGENVSATYGVANTLMSLIRDKAPDYLVCVFDTGKPTFRHEMYDQYKATRQKMPDDLIEQLPRAKEAVKLLGIKQMEQVGFEADDLIGTLAKKGEAEGYSVVMVTGDKDFMQLVDENISMFIPMKNTDITPLEVEEQFGVPPEKIIDLFALMGDASDNIPGVPKVGKKTAVELINDFGTLDNVLDRWEEIQKPSIQKSVGENRDMALLSRKLVTIKTDVPLEYGIDELRFDGIDKESARQFFREMEFTRLLDMVGAEETPQQPRKQVTVVTNDTFDDFIGIVSGASEMTVDLETTSVDAMRADIVGISIAAVGKIWYLPIAHTEGDNLKSERVLPELKKIFADPGIQKIGHNIKYDAIILKRHGMPLSSITFDTMLAAYLLHPGSRGYSLKKLSEEHLNHRMQPITELIGKGKNQVSFAEVSIESAALYSGDDAETTAALKEIFAPQLEEEGLTKLFTDIEMPLMEVLISMEMRGVTLDIPFLNEMSEDLSGKITQLEGNIYEAAGEEFNINSPKQLGEILFEKIGLKTRRKTKTGYSTDIDTLTVLAHQHELPALILEYRKLAKLKSTYVDALPAIVNPETGRVHTSYNQAVAVTGRLSSSDPNLQNIPIRTELGRTIRKAFIPPPGYLILSADYSQIELRIMAHMSGDALLTEAFLNGEDVHTKTASNLFGIFPGMVSDDQRRQAKTINFGVMYGMGAFSLSEQLGIKRAVASAFIDNYFATHTGVSKFFETIVETAKETGVVTTLQGRKRSVAEINSTNRNVSEFARRTAINTPIQGSAADLIKISMIELLHRLEREKCDAHIILQVHDELVLEVAENDLDRVTKIVKETMEGAMELSVPLLVDIGHGNNWLEAH